MAAAARRGARLAHAPSTVCLPMSLTFAPCPQRVLGRRVSQLCAPRAASCPRAETSADASSTCNPRHCKASSASHAFLGCRAPSAPHYRVRLRECSNGGRWAPSSPFTGVVLNQHNQQMLLSSSNCCYRWRRGEWDGHAAPAQRSAARRQLSRRRPLTAILCGWFGSLLPSSLFFCFPSGTLAASAPEPVCCMSRLSPLQAGGPAVCSTGGARCADDHPYREPLRRDNTSSICNAVT